MINSYLTVEELKNAIIHDQVGTIQKVKGIGNKTAHRIILELKDKIRKEGFEQGIIHSTDNTLRNEALSALITLGIKCVSGLCLSPRFLYEPNALKYLRIVYFYWFSTGSMDT